jgi:N-methylhydantoinase A
VKTINQDLLRMDVAEARAVLATQIEEGHRLLASEGVEIETVTVHHEADMQYVGQTHVLTVPIARTGFERDELLLAFERAYWERFQIELRQMRCLVMNLRTAVIGRRHPVELKGLAVSAGGPVPGPVASRRVWFDEGWVDTPIYRREHLRSGVEFAGPAVVEQLDATTIVEPGDRVCVDALGNLEITVRAL